MDLTHLKLNFLMEVGDKMNMNVLGIILWQELVEVEGVEDGP